MQRGHEFTAKAVALFESSAAVFLAATMLLTIADVVLRSLNPEWRIFGVVELVQFTFDSLIFLAIPAVFLLGQNVLVNMFDGFLSHRVLRMLMVMGSLASLVYLGFFASQILVTSLETLEFNDTTQDLQIPLFAYWIPIWIGIGGALLAEVLQLIIGRPRDPEQRSSQPSNPQQRNKG